MGGGGGAHDGSDLHALGHVAGVVELGDLAGGEANLVAVAGVAGRGGGHELALRELAGAGGGDGDRRVGGAGDAHGLVDVAAAGQRVADGAADARGRAAERLDLRGVVVRLVLEEEQPVLVLAIHVHLHLDGAGVDLLGLVEVLEDALLLEPLGADGAHVHETDGLGVAAELVADLEVLVERGLDDLVIDLNVLELRAEGGVAAVVRPVGVDDANLGDSGVTPLAGEVFLAELDVREVHGEAAVGDEGGETCLIELEEGIENLNVGRGGDLHLERRLGRERRLAGLDGVDHVVLDGVDVGGGELAGEDVDLGGSNVRALAGAHELDTLAGGIRALVELTGQVLHGEDGGAGRSGGDEAALIELNALDGQLGGGGVDLRLAEDDGDAALEQGLIDPLDVIAVDDAEARQATDTEDGAQLLCELLRLHVEARLLLNVGAEDHSSCPSRCWTCPPCCGRRPFPYMERAARARRAVATQLGGRNQAFIMTRDGRAWGEAALRFSGSKRRAAARSRGCSSRRLR